MMTLELTPMLYFSVIVVWFAMMTAFGRKAGRYLTDYIHARRAKQVRAWLTLTLGAPTESYPLCSVWTVKTSSGWTANVLVGWRNSRHHGEVLVVVKPPPATASSSGGMWAGMINSLGKKEYSVELLRPLGSILRELEEELA